MREREASVPSIPKKRGEIPKDVKGGAESLFSPSGRLGDQEHVVHECARVRRLTPYGSAEGRLAVTTQAVYFTPCACLRPSPPPQAGPRACSPACMAPHGQAVLGSWVGVRRPFHISLFLTAPRVVLPQYPSTVLMTIKSKRKKTLKECYSCIPARASDCMNARAESTAIHRRRRRLPRAANNYEYGSATCQEQARKGAARQGEPRDTSTAAAPSHLHSLLYFHLNVGLKAKARQHLAKDPPSRADI